MLEIPRLHHSFYIEIFDKVLRRYTLQFKKEGLVRMAHAIFKSFEAVVVHEFSQFWQTLTNPANRSAISIIIIVAALESGQFKYLFALGISP